MTPEKLKEIEARCKAASEGPWEPRESLVLSSINHSVARCHLDRNQGIEKAEAKANATFIAHARTDVPALIARVKELEVENTRLEEHSKQIASHALEVKGLSVDEMQAQFDEWAEQKLKELTGDLEGRIKSIDTDMIPEFERVKDELSRLRAENENLEERIASAKSGLVVQHENAFVDPEDVRATIAILDGCNVTVDEEVNRLRAENKKLRVALGGIAMLTELIEDREDGDPILRTLRNTGCVARAALGGGDE